VNRFEPNLRIPGPTSLPDAVREAGARQMVNHRGPEFAVLQNSIVERLKRIYKTENDVLILTAAGTAASRLRSSTSSPPATRSSPLPSGPSATASPR